MSGTFGPIVQFYDVEQAVKTTLQAWIDTYLGELERQSPRWGLREVERPHSWEVVSEYHNIISRSLPAISIESGGMADEPQVGGDHLVSGDWTITVQIVIKEKSRTRSRDMLSMYEAALRTLFFHRGDLGGFAAGTTIGRPSYDLIPPAYDRTLVGCEIPLTVTVSDINRKGGGPETPDDPPDVPLPETSPTDPVHLTTTVAVSDL